MPRKIPRKFYKWAEKGWLILTLAAGLVVYLAVTLPILQAAPGGDIEALDAQIFYTPEKAFSTVASYGMSKQLWTFLYLTWDIITPILYTLTFSLSLSWLFQRSFKPKSNFKILNVIPVGAGIFDIIENISIVALFIVYPSQPIIVAWVGAFSTLFKVSFMGVSVLLILIGLVLAAVNKFKKNW
jgi:hypothetical protein